MNRCILAHDLGTTGNKATLYNVEGELLNSVFAGYDTSYPADGWAEQNPKDWWSAVCLSTRELIEDSGIKKEDIGVVSFSGQMMGCLPVDEEGNPLRSAIIWADQRSTAQAQKLRDKLGEKNVYRITGHRISSSYSVEKIMWIQDNQPEIFGSAYKFLQAKDYIVYKLTGKFVTDYSDATGMNLFDIKQRKWSGEILAAAGLDAEKLPVPHASAEIVGKVRKQEAREAGLAPGIPVVAGAGDGAAATVGAGAAIPGKAYNYVGSSSWIALTAKEPIFDEERRTFNWLQMNPDYYMPCGTMNSAGGSYKWVRDNLCQLETEAAEKLGISPYEIINAEIKASKPGSGRLLFLPYLLGERSPHWDPEARGAFIGLSQRNDKQDILRSVLEGVTFNLNIIVEIFSEKMNFPELRVIGGGAKGRVWRQIMADIYEKKVLKPRILQNATSLGAAIGGGIGIGLFDNYRVAGKLNPVEEILEPDAGNVKGYRCLYDIFKKAYNNLQGIFAELSAMEKVDNKAD